MKKYLILIILLIGLQGFAQLRDDKIIAVYNATIVRVKDGDTMVINVSIGFDLVMRGTFRILELDTYETRLIRGTTPEEKAKGLEGKEYAKSILMDKVIKIVMYGYNKDKYGRWLCQIKIDNKDYATIMKAKGYNKP